MQKNLSEKELKKLAPEIRSKIIEILEKAGSGHCAGPLGAVEIYLSLYFGGILNYDPHRPDWPERDRVVVSNGHYAPLLYIILAYAGFFAKKVGFKWIADIWDAPTLAIEVAKNYRS